MADFPLQTKYIYWAFDTPTCSLALTISCCFIKKKNICSNIIQHVYKAEYQKLLSGVLFSSVGRVCRPMCQGSAADLGSTPSPGPFAACHTPSLSPCFCHIFSCTFNKAIKRPQKLLSGKEWTHSWRSCCWLFLIDMFVTAGEGMYSIILVVHSGKAILFDTFQDSFCVKLLHCCCALPCQSLINKTQDTCFK